jgi:hypothetical protein
MNNDIMFLLINLFLVGFVLYEVRKIRQGIHKMYCKPPVKSTKHVFLGRGW